MYELSNGRCVADETISNKLLFLKKNKVERPLQENSTGYSWDEAGMADLFSELYNTECRYCAEFKNWYIYQNGKWCKDVDGLLVAQRIKEFTRIMSLYCGEISDTNTRSSYMKFVAKMGDRRFRERLQRDAKDCLIINANKFDANPYLINCKNGTYNLETMTFQEHSYNDYLTMQTNFSYGVAQQKIKNSANKKWQKFIEEITENNADKQNFLQRALGYSLLGLPKEECMFILWGKTTRNGKSTLLNAVQHMLGDYSAVLPVDLICKTRYGNGNGNGATPYLAKLKGKRFVTLAENENTSKLDEAIIKQYTGGEAITARELYSSPITFIPQFKMWLSCNDLPGVSDRSLFASERLKVIEFTKHFGASEQDKTLKQQFETEESMRAIFTWLLNGYELYTKHGLTLTPAMQEVVKQYETENDTVLQFLTDTYEYVNNEYADTRAKTLYDDFKIWCASTGAYTMSAKRFNAELLTHTGWYGEKIRRADGYVYTKLQKK